MNEEIADALEDAQQTPVEEQQQEAGQDEGQDVAVDDKQEEKDDLPVGVKKSIARATRQKYEAIRRAEALEAKNKDLEERLSRLENPPKPRPRLEEFDSQEEYEDALLDWRDQRRAEPAKQQEDKGQQFSPDIVADWNDRCEDAKQVYADFDAVARNPYLPVSPEMAEILLEMDNGTDVLYQLGKNPEEAARISQLSAVSAARELGKIEAKLSGRKPQSQSKAPEPIKPAGSTAKVEKDPSEMDPSEFAQWRKKFIGQRR